MVPTSGGTGGPKDPKKWSARFHGVPKRIKNGLPTAPTTELWLHAGHSPSSLWRRAWEMDHQRGQRPNSPKSHVVHDDSRGASVVHELLKVGNHRLRIKVCIWKVILNATFRWGGKGKEMLLNFKKRTFYRQDSTQTGADFPGVEQTLLPPLHPIMKHRHPLINTTLPLLHFKEVTCFIGVIVF